MIDRITLFIEKANKIHNNIYDYSLVDYNGSHSHITIICKKHGSFNQSPTNHLSGRGCHECAQIKRAASKTNTTKAFIKKANLIHYNKYNYSKVNYSHSKNKIIIICPLHGEFVQSPTNHLSGRGCSICKKEKRKINNLNEKHNEDYINVRKEKFIQKSKSIYKNKFTYNEVTYINSNTKVNIKCNIHGLIKQTPNSHLNSKYGCYKCGYDAIGNKRRLDTNTFTIKANHIHNNKYDYSKVNYIKYSKNVKITCLKHGDFKQAPYNHLSGKGCPICANNIRNNDRKVSFKDFLKQAVLKFNNKFKYSEYTLFTKSVKIYCPEHGEFEAVPHLHLEQVHGCSKCAGLSKITEEVFLKRAKRAHNNKYNYSKINYVDRDTKIIIICKNHGEFLQTPKSHLKGSGCMKCSISVSKGEMQWIERLQKDNVNIITNQVLKINGRTFKPDGYDPVTKTIYEYNGNYFHGNPEVYHPDDINVVSRKTFGELYKKTIEREQFLINNGFKVIAKWE